MKKSMPQRRPKFPRTTPQRKFKVVDQNRSSLGSAPPITMETLDADVDPETETDAAELQNAPKHHGTPYIMCDQKSVAFPDHMPDTMPDTMESSLPRRNP